MAETMPLITIIARRRHRLAAAIAMPMALLLLCGSTPAQDLSLRTAIEALGVTVLSLGEGPDIVEVTYDSALAEPSIVVFAAALQTMQSHVPDEATASLTALQNGEQTLSIKTRPAKIPEVIDGLLSPARAEQLAQFLASPPGPISQPAVVDGVTPGAPEADTGATAQPSPRGVDAPRLARPRRLSRPKGPDVGATFHGPTGLIRTPNAEVLDEGSARLSITNPAEIKSATVPPSTVPDFREQWTSTIGILPRVEAGAAYSDADIPGTLLWRDITLHGKIQLLRESDHRPSVAVGASNVRQAVGDANLYIVGSKVLADGRVRATAGVADGELDGVFGGAEVQLTPWAQAVVEYDGDRMNTALRLRPTPGAQIDVADMQGGVGVQFAYAFGIGPHEPRPGPDVVLIPAEDAASPEALAERVADAVLALGMENVQVTVGEGLVGLEIGVTYENRRYYHDELEALGLVFAATARVVPASAATLHAVALDHQVPVLRVSINTGDYRAYLRGDLAAQEFASGVETDYGLRPDIHPSIIVARTRRAESTARSIDVQLVPGFRTILGSEDVTLAVQPSVRPDVDIDLGHGLSVRAAEEVRLSNNLGPLVHYFSGDQRTVNYAFRSGSRLLGHVAAGDFADERRGVAAEGFMLPGSNSLLVRGYVGYLKDMRFFGGGLGSDFSYTGDARYWLSDLDLEANVTVGRYLDLDTGYTLGVRRFFGDNEIQLEYKDTDLSQVLALTATAAIGRRRNPKPGSARLRVGDRASQQWRSVADDDGQLSVASLVGNQLRYFDISDSFLNRDRFVGDVIRRHVGIFRWAARATETRR